MNQSISAAAPQRFIVLDSFRGLCALSVVVFHLHLLQGFSEWDFFRSAGLMVEFFFILSGFVLAHRYGAAPFNLASLSQFMLSRTFRIVPLHLAMLLLFSLLTLHLGGAFDADTQAQWWYQLLLLQAWLPDADPFAFNGPAWSISVEYYLYVLFGLILWAVSKGRYLIFAAIVAACAVCVWLGLDFSRSGGFRGLMCFFLGALTYHGFVRWPAARLNAVWGTIVEVLLLVALYFVITAQYPTKSFYAAWAFALGVWLFAFESGAVSKLLRHDGFVNMGKWSFSIYLTHYAVLYLLELGLERFAPALLLQHGEKIYLSLGSAWGDNTAALLILALVLILSRWSYQQIEMRGVRWGRRVQAWLPEINDKETVKV